MPTASDPEHHAAVDHPATTSEARDRGRLASMTVRNARCFPVPARPEHPRPARRPARFRRPFTLRSRPPASRGPTRRAASVSTLRTAATPYGKIQAQHGGPVP